MALRPLWPGQFMARHLQCGDPAACRSRNFFECEATDSISLWAMEAENGHDVMLHSMIYEAITHTLLAVRTSINFHGVEACDVWQIIKQKMFIQYIIKMPFFFHLPNVSESDY